MTAMTMTTKGSVLALTMLSACVIELSPVGDDEGDTSSEETSSGEASSGESSSSSDDADGSSSSSESTTDPAETSSTGESTTDDGSSTGESTESTGESTDEGTTGGGECGTQQFPNYFDLAIELGGEPIGGNLDLDLACTTVDDGSAVLQLDCPQFDLAIGYEGELAGEIPDEAGTTVHVRLITESGGWFVAEKWLRLDFVGQGRSVFVIEAITLDPPNPTTWIAPWGLAIVDECTAIDDGCGEWVGQTLGISRDGQSLELLHGDQGSLPGGLVRMWNEQSWRYETIGPACDTVGEWKKVAIVSDNLVESEVCDPGESDPCGPGLECCYPCGIPDCDFICTPEDPDTMSCPPPPP
jgi:hypothetical protein